ncbi:hypothetical protein AAMO2058_000280200, partial [Amorphochlora amoebiformis]
MAQEEWQARYFILYSNQLLYYKKENDRDPAGRAINSNRSTVLISFASTTTPSFCLRRWYQDMGKPGDETGDPGCLQPRVHCGFYLGNDRLVKFILLKLILEGFP